MSKLEVENLVTAVRTKFNDERQRVRDGKEQGKLFIPSLSTVEEEVARVIHEWAAAAETRMTQQEESARIRGFDQGSEWGADRHWS